MTLTQKVKLLPTKEQQELIVKTMREYIALTNDILNYALALGEMPKLSSAKVCAALPSALRGQCVRDVQRIWRKRHKGKLPVLRKPAAIWNNQNYKIEDNSVSFPVLVNRKSCRIKVKALIPSEVLFLLRSCKLGALRITAVNDKLVAQIAYDVPKSSSAGSEIMGVDLGIKCPAVVAMSNGTKRFYGNGRQNKFIRRRYAKKRKNLGKAKKLNAIRNLKNKEQRWMRDQDHKISRAIVNDAIAHNVGTIKLEALSGVRSATRKSRKNNRSLHSWSFYRLAQFIEYKAKLAGIDVVYVNPAYTSQTCPVCGKRNHAQDRQYVCSCGFHAHRDCVGAVNILAA